MTKRDIAGLVVFVIAVGLAASFGVRYLPGEWYASLAKPNWTPPNGVFAPVWTVLYIMIAVAGWLVWRAEGGRRALALWIGALVFNASWSWWMFGEHRIGVALIVIVALWCLIAEFIFAARRVSKPAALLFLPYWAWVSFAAALNFAVWRMNG